MYVSSVPIPNDRINKTQYTVSIYTLFVCHVTAP